MKLVTDDELERSAIVANCRMNRERDLTGSNGYANDLRFSPLDFLKSRVVAGRPAAWLDLCCGTGRALIQAASCIRAEALSIEVVGVDLVGMFHRPEPGMDCLRLVEASLSTWHPDRPFDLITCVHGLHYIGDKLRLIALAASWLVDDGLFTANLDLDNLKLADDVHGRKLLFVLRRAGLVYDRKTRLVGCQGRKSIELPLRYLGANDQAGPNYTGQEAVNSYYETLSPCR